MTTTPIFTITPVENGWMIHVTEPSGSAALVSNNRTFVARNAAEVSEIVEELALEQSIEEAF